MTIFLSPGINFTEIDLTTVIPQVSVSTGAFAGVFRWGPIGELFLVDSENTLVQYFGKPTNFNAETFFTAANFLSYANQLYISRAANTSGATPFGTFTATESNNVFLANAATMLLLSQGMYITQTSNIEILPSVGNRIVVDSINASAFVCSIDANASGTVELWFGNPETTYTAMATLPGAFVDNLCNQIVHNEHDYYARNIGLYTNGQFVNAKGDFDTNVFYVAKYPGAIGNSLRIGVCDNPTSYTSTIDLGGPVLKFDIGSNYANVEFTGASNASVASIVNDITIGDQILAGNSSMGFLYNTVNSISVNTAYLGPNEDYGQPNTQISFYFNDPYILHTPFSTGTITRFWEFFNVVSSSPGQSNWVLYNGNTAAYDELTVVVVDNNGLFSGTPGTVLEVFENVSRANDAKNIDGSDNYYADVINQHSAYVWWTNDISTAYSANAVNVSTSTSPAPWNFQMEFGADGHDESHVSLATLGTAYKYFVSPEDISIGLIMQGYPAGGLGQSWQLANWIIQNICEVRRDCVMTMSPDLSLLLNQYGNEAVNMVKWRNSVVSSNYAIMDSGYKYMYDQYNDIYRWIPLNGDIAGLCARTDQTNNPWWSPAGLNRGVINNLVKLAYNPKQSDRDVLYPAGINPVITLPGVGTVLYGDKTMQAFASAFDRINVRRLFIVLEKAISLAAKHFLFEFNDQYTQNQFLNMVNPYLRNIHGLRGITDFLVVCDATNNTPEVVDHNEFIADIYIKPARSINYIQLNFIAVPTGTQFSEVVGNY
jgi:hypothetical protein